MDFGFSKEDLQKYIIPQRPQMSAAEKSQMSQIISDVYGGKSVVPTPTAEVPNAFVNPNITDDEKEAVRNFIHQVYNGASQNASANEVTPVRKRIPVLKKQSDAPVISEKENNLDLVSASQNAREQAIKQSYDTTTKARRVTEAQNSRQKAIDDAIKREQARHEIKSETENVPTNIYNTDILGNDLITGTLSLATPTPKNLINDEILQKARQSKAENTKAKENSVNITPATLEMYNRLSQYALPQGAERYKFGADRAMALNRAFNENSAEIQQKYGLSDNDMRELELNVKKQVRDAFNTENEKRAQTIGEEHPILGTVASLGDTALMPIESAANTLTGLVGGDERLLDDSLLGRRTAYREGTKENINADLGKSAYDIGTGFGDMGVAALESALTGGTVPAGAIMGLNTAEVAQNQALNNGAGVRQASLYGAGAGVLDAYFNTKGLDFIGNRLKKEAVTGVKDVLKNVGAGALTESLENVAQDVAQTVVDSVINGKNSDLRTLYQNYINNGADESTAFKNTAIEYTKQLVSSGATGALFGGAFAGVKSMPKLKKYNEKMLKQLDPADRELRSRNVRKNHTPEEINNMIAYSNSTDTILKDYIQEVRDDKSGYHEPINLGKNSLSVVEKIKELTGIDTTNNNTIFDKETVLHTDKRHGKNGKNDSSMSDDNSLARIQYVLQNPDEIYRGKGSNGGKRLANGESAPTVVFVKKIDGQYYAVEAVTDAKSQTNNIIGAYIGNRDSIEENIKKGSIVPVEDVNNVTPSGTPEIEPESTPNLNVANETQNVNTANPIEETNNVNVNQNIENADPTNDTFAQPIPKKDLSQYPKGNTTVDVQYHKQSIADSIDTLEMSKENKQTARVMARKLDGIIDQFNNAKTEQEVKAAMDNLEATYVQLESFLKDNAKVTRNIDSGNAQARAELRKALRGLKINMNSAEVSDRTMKELNSVLFSGKKDGKFARNSGTKIDEIFDELDAQLGSNLSSFMRAEGLDPDVPQDQMEGLYRYAKAVKEGGKEISRTEAYSGGVFDEVFRDMVNKAGVKLDNAEAYSQMQKMAKSKVYTNTLTNNKLANMLDEVDQYGASYEKHYNAETLQNARQRVTDDSDGWTQRYISGEQKVADDTDIDTVMTLLLDKKTQIDELSKGKGNEVEIERLTSETNLLKRKLRETGTKAGQEVQAFSKWNGTAEGAVINAERIIDEEGSNWGKRNVRSSKKVDATSSRLEKILRNMGNDSLKASNRNGKVKAPKTHDEILKEVENTLKKEMAGVEGQFTPADYEVVTNFLENNIPDWQIEDEITHRLSTGDWYSLDESIEAPRQRNGKIGSALRKIIDSDMPKTENAELSFDEIQKQVRNTIDDEMGSLSKEFDDNDIKYLANMVQNGANAKDLSDMMRNKLANGAWEIPQETIQKVNDLFDEARYFEPDSRDRVEIETEAFWELANAVSPKASLVDKFDAWRYLSMLGNGKTHVRNMFGNALFQGVTSMSNAMAAIMESGVDVVAKKLNNGQGIERTKALLTTKDNKLIKACREDATIGNYRALSGNKYMDNVKSAIRNNKEVFDSKFMRWLSNKNTDALNAEDFAAMQFKYQTSMAGFLKANGMDESIFDAERQFKNLKKTSETRLLSDSERLQMDSLRNKVEMLEKARDYGVKQAEYSAFHEDNAVADLISQFSKNMANHENGIVRGLGKLEQGLLPFKKTPANILRSGIEYSPVGLLKNITTDAYKLYKGQINASQFIENISKSVTGTALVAVGAWLYDRGYLLSSDDETQWQDSLEGKQNYSIRVNDKSYTIDFAAPSVMPLLLGAEFKKLSDARNKPIYDANGNIVNDPQEPGSFWNKFRDVFNSASRLASPIMETSMLSGLNDTLENVSSVVNGGDKFDALGSLAISTGTSYLTQGLPTLLGQVARTVDNTRRSTYSDEEGVAKTFDKQLNKIENKIPGLSMLNEPYVDTYGREQSNSPFGNPLANAAYQLFSPTYIQSVNETDVDKELRDVYEKTNGNSKFADLETSVKKSDGTKLSEKEYTEYTKAKGENTLPVLRNVFASDFYKNANYDTKSKIIDDALSLTKKIGKEAVDDSYSLKGDDGVVGAYGNNGIQGFLDYEKAKNNGVGLTTSQAKAAEKQGITYEEYAQKKQQKQEAKQEKEEKQAQLSDFGFSKAGVTATWDKASKTIPGLKMEDFSKTYKAIDSDHNEGIKQDEIIDYLNKGNYTQSQATQIWRAYGSSNWKRLPKLKDGKWSAK